MRRLARRGSLPEHLGRPHGHRHPDRPWLPGQCRLRRQGQARYVSRRRRQRPSSSSAKDALAAVDQLPAGSFTRRARHARGRARRAVLGRRRPWVGDPQRHDLDIFFPGESRDWLAWHSASASDPRKWRVDVSASAIEARLAKRPALAALGQLDEGLPSSRHGDDESVRDAEQGQRAPNLYRGQVLARPPGPVYRNAVRCLARSGRAIAPGRYGLSFRRSRGYTSGTGLALFRPPPFSSLPFSSQAVVPYGSSTKLASRVASPV